MPVYLLPENEILFPPPHLARRDGLLALGGDLTPQRLLAAYRLGIFPWYLEGEPILWWSPDPRMVLYPEQLHVARRLRRLIRQGGFEVTLDRDFPAVIRGCADTRFRREKGTWIVSDMVQAYIRLHRLGYAHSVEVWHGGELAGGLYGVSLGRAFFGESMFAQKTDASKAGLVRLVEALSGSGFSLVDCQVVTAHLMQFGARKVSRRRFLSDLEQACEAPTLCGSWTLQDGVVTVEAEPQTGAAT